ncbi:HAD-IIIC family phosphatase [Nocardia thraciensis]
MLTSAARLHAAGGTVDWAGFYAGYGGRRVDLPTYAFQRSRHWLQPTAADTGVAEWDSSGHPFVTAVVPRPESDAVTLIGSLSVQTQPWLADHTVSDVIVFPGAGLVELAVRAGDETGCGTVRELILQAPLIIPRRGAVQVQVVVGTEADGERPVTIYSRLGRDGGAWRQHAHGVLTSGAPTIPPEEFGAWPPGDATPVDLDGAYARLAARGYGYGPAFQGLRSVWRRGDELFADIGLPAGCDAGGFGLHPALLDAALHAALIVDDDSDQVLLPLAWNDVTVSAVGATSLRVRLRRSESGGAALVAADPAGQQVISAASVYARPIPAEQLTVGLSGARRDLYRVEWRPVQAPVVPEGSPVTVVESPPGATAEAVHSATREMLATLQDWLADEKHSGTILLVHTRHAVALPGEDVADLAGAAVWGLVRSAQTENPGRIVLVDTDGPLDIVAAVAVGEPQVVIRGDRTHAARLVREPGAEPERPALAGGSVLVTGAFGAIGRVVARHLASEHKVGRLLLAGRRGLDTPGAGELVAELTALGAEVVVAQCDLADAESVRELVSDTALTGVVHAAGVIDDGTVGSLTPDRLDAVLAPKVDAALHLHEATAHLDLSLFVLFSSVSGVIGSPGQANYAAANAFLDGLAAHRVARGLPAHSLAWGMWAIGLSDSVSGSDRDRIRRAGVEALAPGDGMTLFDTAIGLSEPVLVPVRIDTAVFDGVVPPLLRGLVKAAPRRAAVAAAADPAAAPRFAARVAGLPEDAAVALALDVVREQMAAVLGHAQSADIGAEQSLQNFGFDSLTVVELRNRLRDSTGAVVAVSAIFDNPTPLALARYLVAAVADGEVPAIVRAEDAEVPEVESWPAPRDVMRLIRSAQHGVPAAAHTVAMAVRLDAELTAPELEATLDRLAGRHAAMRTAIVPSAEYGRSLEVRRAPAGPLLRVDRVADLSDDTVAERLRVLLEPAFDLATDRLWRFELLETDSGAKALIFGAHHSVSDIASMLLVAGELDAELSGRPAAAAASNRDIDDLVTAQERRAAETGNADWRAEFSGCGRIDLVPPEARPAARSYRSGTLALDLPDGLLDRVSERARELDITPAAFFLGVLTVLLARRRSLEKFVLAVPVDTRIYGDAPDAVGYFGVPMPYPATVDAGEPVAEVLRRTGSRLRRLLTHGTGFSDALALLAAEGLYRDNAPMVEVYFNFLRSGRGFDRLEAVPAASGSTDLDLMVTVMADLGRIGVIFNRDILDEDACAELGAEYLGLLAEIAESPDRPVRPQPPAPSPAVALGATFALGSLPQLCGLALEGIPVAEAPYHHVLTALRDPSGVFAASSTGLGVVLLRGADLERFGPVTDDVLAELAAGYPAAVRSLTERTRRPLIIGFLPSHTVEERFVRWERQVADDLRELPGVAVVEADRWARRHPVEDRFDERTEALAHLPFTPEFQAAVALTLADIVAAASAPAPKVIAVDGDETLWSGVAGEVGAEAVDLTGPRARLARRLSQWRSAGALLVLVSNNDDATVRAVLNRPDAILRAEHFSMISTGWRPKTERLTEAARELRLGIDSFVFLDDNPVEIARVRAELPEVLSLTCPGADELDGFLQRLWPVVPLAVTAEDAARSRFYDQERDREAVRDSTEFAEFLARLELRVDVAELTEETAERSAQLIRRTNQFALHAVAAGELERWRRDGEVWTATARDRFGDYGQIAVLAVRAEADALRVLGWHLSCRALGRGVEERLLAWLADRADDLGRDRVRLTAHDTGRNVPAHRLVAALGDGDPDAPTLDVTVSPDRLRAYRSWKQR